MLDHLSNSGQQIAELTLVLKADRDTILLVEQMDEAPELALRVVARPHHAVFDDLAPYAVVNLRCVLNVVLAVCSY